MAHKRYYLVAVPIVLAFAILMGLGIAMQPSRASRAAGESAAPVARTAARLQGFSLLALKAYGPRSAQEQAAPTTVCTPDIALPDKLDAYWPLDDGAAATTFADIIGGTNGSCVGSACPTSVNGIVKTAFSFDGNDEIDVPDNPDFNWGKDESFSIELWVNMTGECTGREVFVGKYKGTLPGVNTSWWVGCEAGTNVAAFNLRDSTGDPITGTVNLFGDTPINDGRWHQIVAVREGNTNKNRLYVDNVQEDNITLDYTGNFSSNAAVNIGYYDTGSMYHFNGMLDEVAIYNKPLSTTEIQRHYNSRKGQSYCNDAPTAQPDTLAATEDTPLNFTAANLLSNDIDLEGTTVSVQSVDSTTANGGTVSGSYVYTPPANFNGTDTFYYTARDNPPSGGGAALTTVVTVTVTVNPVNDAPTLTQPANRTSQEGETVSGITLQAADVDASDTLTFSATGLPAGVSINPTTGVISGALGYQSAGVYPVTVTVKDGGNLSDTKSFTWTVTDVNRAPVITNPGNQLDGEGESINLVIQVSDADTTDTLQFTVSGLPVGLNFNTTNHTISGVIPEGAATGSPYTVTIVVSDGKASDTETFTWTVQKQVTFNNKVFVPLLVNSLSQ